MTAETAIAAYRFSTLGLATGNQQLIIHIRKKLCQLSIRYFILANLVAMLIEWLSETETITAELNNPKYNLLMWKNAGFFRMEKHLRFIHSQIIIAGDSRKGVLYD
jgi:hypothetical protein